ncbi:MAG: hypothetical protein CR993_06645 [Rhodobacterales bacterium]|nr:MAG: hypothetical protein CR993_06645 [Rhodobacterales bacterium]
MRRQASGRGRSVQRDFRTGWAVLILAALGALWLLWGRWVLDLSALFVAARLYAEGNFSEIYVGGGTVFLTDPPESWLWVVAETGGNPAGLTPYLYPPLWLAVLAPFVEGSSAIGFFNAMTVVNVASVVVMIWAAYAMLEQEGAFTRFAVLGVLIAVISAPGALGLWLGQPQFLVSALILAAGAMLARGREVPAGVLLALAVAVKLSPAIFVLLFVYEKAWRALGAFVVALGGLVALSVGLTGWGLHREMLDLIAAIDGQVLVSRIVASLELWLFQIGTVLAGDAVWQIRVPWMVPEPEWIAPVVRVVLIALVALTWATTRTTPAPARRYIRLMALSLIGTITSPLGWTHTLILPLLMLPGLPYILPGKRGWALLLFVTIALSLPLLLTFSGQPWAAFPQAGLHLLVPVFLLAAILIPPKSPR